MNFRLLQTFRAVCETGGVSKAAELLHVTQPAVTLAIQQLERESGVRLFERLSGRLHLTAGGREFLAAAVRLLELHDALRTAGKELENRTPLRVGSCITIACFWLPRILMEFAGKVAGGAVTTVASARSIFAMLENNTVDIALYEGAPPRGPIVSEPFSSYKLVGICPPRHRFACATATIEDLVAEPLLLREPGSAIRDIIDSHLRMHNLTAEPAMTSVNTQAILQAVMAGVGIGIVPEAIARPDSERGRLATFQLDGVTLGNVNMMLWHKDKHLTASMLAFMDCVRRCGDENPADHEEVGEPMA